MNLRILNAEPAGYSDEARAALRSIGELVERAVPQDRLADEVRGFDVLIVRLGLRVTREVLEAAPRLRAVVSATTGLDHIDLQSASARGVEVLSLRGEKEFLRTIHATAEHAWALVLGLARHVPWAFEDVLRGAWDRDAFRGRELCGRRLGLWGLGRVGEQVAGYGLAFGMRVAAFDPTRGDWPDRVERVDDLDALLARSDVLSVHVPLTDATRGALDRRRLALLPRGALLVNTSRGATIDERALVDRLAAGWLGGAAVDVLEEEQDPARRAASPLLARARTHGDLLVTPHLGGATIESMRRTEVFMAEKLRRFLRGEGGASLGRTG